VTDSVRASRNYATEQKGFVMKRWFHRTTKTPRAVQPSDLVRFKRLPAHVNVRETIATHSVTLARDPYGGRDTERDFVIRYGDPFDE
jgi:hypothetical protein